MEEIPPELDVPPSEEEEQVLERRLGPGWRDATPKQIREVLAAEAREAGESQPPDEIRAASEVERRRSGGSEEDALRERLGDQLRKATPDDVRAAIEEQARRPRKD